MISDESGVHMTPDASHIRLITASPLATRHSNTALSVNINTRGLLLAVLSPLLGIWAQGIEL